MDGNIGSIVLYDREGFKGFDNTSTFFTANIFH